MTERLPNPFSSAPAEPIDAAMAPDPAADLIGRVIGNRYRITRIVGRGGMGVVYGGEHLELGLPVAIKVLPASYARDAETLKRFEREARTASRVRHPNVVTVFDLGRLDTGEPYLAMELLIGRDLSDIIGEGVALPLKEVLAILEPLAAALDALHREGVVHRDIKPSNIFFSRGAGGSEALKLVDFGLAALHTGDGSERLTRSGHVIGTAIYMAPEGARGALIGPAGDIYSMGVVAFELLTGLPPFDGAPMAVLMDKVAGVAPSLETVGKRPYDPRIEAAMAAALHRTPENRPTTATAFVDALRVGLDERGVATSDRPPPPRPVVGPTEIAHGPRSQRPTTNEIVVLPQQSRAPLIGAAVLAILGLTGAGAWYATRSPSVPEAPRTSAPVAPALVPIALPDPPLDPETPPADPRPSVAVGVDVPVDPPSSADPVRADRVRSRPPPPSISATASPPEAERPTAEVASDSTDRTPALLREASSAMLHGEIPRARDLYREATLAAPRNAAAWRGLGLASERLSLAPEARRAYARYLELAPDARDAATVRGRLDALGP